MTTKSVLLSAAQALLILTGIGLIGAWVVRSLGGNIEPGLPVLGIILFVASYLAGSLR